MMQRIAVVGVGKLGLCFALNLERSGFVVYGIESNIEYLQQLRSGRFSSSEPEVNSLLPSANGLYFSDEISEIITNDIRDIFLMVATPSLEDGGYDHSQIERVAEKLIAIATPSTQRHLYIGCTTMPGYCNELASKLSDFGYTVSYNPEFIAQGAIIKDQLYPDQVLIGEANTEVGDRLQRIYERMVLNEPTYCRMNTLSAEIAKLATNCFLTTKISFANSIGDLATKAGADADKILAAIGSDSRIGSKYLGYGFGFGGPCFPRDNRALGKFAQQANYPLRLSDATDQVNHEHHQFLLNQYLNSFEENAEIVFDGVAYKRGTTQITESQQLRLAVALVKAGRKVRIIDSKEVIDQIQKLHPGLFVLQLEEADLQNVNN
ncbi:MAG: UDP-glucose/GDP-mannose dehydrogenase family protein [Flavobacteriales bacterium]|nr:UDP-glucose/GDP-mannose dehydrogenase family protein [Flavobacteriales bacterium]